MIHATPTVAIFHVPVLVLYVQVHSFEYPLAHYLKPSMYPGGSLRRGGGGWMYEAS